MSAREFGDQLLQRLLHHAQDTVPGVVGAGLSLVGKEGPRSVSAVGVAASLDPLQWAHGQGPLPEALVTGRSLVLPGAAGSFEVLRWPALAQAVSREGIPWPAGVVVATGEWGEETDQPVLFGVYTEVAPQSAHLAELDRFEGLLASALAVVEYCAGEELRAEQMIQMVQYRRVIEQAKGMVMAATGADAGAAFSTLARASQHFNLRLRNLAVALVEHVGGAPAEGPDDPAQIVVPSVTDRRTAAQVWAALTRTRPREPTAG
ncbi:MAG TPA: ANTAR domain-containing protein [Kineosporiaceae bacterium]|nr:ANTAR domain-containing protein [Kineosporiaceae bacterium]